MQVDDRAGDRHAEAGTVRLGREKQVEGPRERFLRHARSRVLDGHRHRPGRRRVCRGDRQPARAFERLQRVQDQVQEGLLQLACVETALGAGRVIGRDDVDALGRPAGARQLQALVEQRVQRRRHAMELGRTSERGDLGDDARQVVHRHRDLAGQILPRGILDLRQVLLEVAHVEPQAGQRVLHLVRDLRRHASERRNGATLEALEVVRVADRDRRLRREQREELEVVLPRLEPRRRLDHQCAGRAALDDERRRDDRAALSALGHARRGDRDPFVHRRRGRRLESSPRRRRRPGARHRHETALLELEHHAAIRVGRLDGGLSHGVQHAGHDAG